MNKVGQRFGIRYLGFILNQVYGIYTPYVGIKYTLLLQILVFHMNLCRNVLGIMGFLFRYNTTTWEVWSTWEVWRALKKLELLLSCSPNFPRAP